MKFSKGQIVVQVCGDDTSMADFLGSSKARTRKRRVMVIEEAFEDGSALWNSVEFIGHPIFKPIPVNEMDGEIVEPTMAETAYATGRIFERNLKSPPAPPPITASP